MVAGLTKASQNPDEVGPLARTLFVFIGVPMRAGGANLSYIASPITNVKNLAGSAIRKAEVAAGGTGYGKYNQRIGTLELQLKDQRKLLDDANPEVAEAARESAAAN